MVNVLKLAVNGRKRWLPYEYTTVRKCRSDAIFLLNRFIKMLLLLGSTGGAAGTGFLDFLQVANDLGCAFLDGLAVGTHHKAA